MISWEGVDLVSKKNCTRNHVWSERRRRSAAWKMFSLRRREWVQHGREDERGGRNRGGIAAAAHCGEVAPLGCF